MTDEEYDYDQGGTLPPGLTIENQTDRPEPAFSQTQWETIAQLVDDTDEGTRLWEVRYSVKSERHNYRVVLAGTLPGAVGKFMAAHQGDTNLRLWSVICRTTEGIIE